MLVASGCHKDSFSFDEFTRPTTTNSDDGTPPTPNIRISSTDRTAQEGSGQIVLRINSDADAPAGGLAVMITIAGAMAGEFTANAPATCTANLVCTVRILEGNRVGNLVLMPTSDSAMENSEEWTASLVDGGSNYNFAANNNVAFDITDPTTPGPMIPSLPVVGIATGDMPIEDGAGVTLTITSSETVPATLTGGLSVTINIVGADAADFNNAVCTNLVCIVTIPAGSNSVSLILSPLSDFSTEPGERWTATLVDTGAYNPAAGGDDNVGFDITDLIAAVGIATSDMPIEGGAGVTLTITSSDPVPATLTGGLIVTVNIGGEVDAAEFTSANCIALVCEVVIDPTETTAILIITPSPDTAPEGGSEDWTATIAPDTDNNIFTVDSSTDNATFAVANMLPPVTEALMIADLNAYNSPIPLAVSEIRAGVESASVGPIVGFQYNDADNNPRVLVERLDYAHLGIRINGDIAAADFDFAHLNENVVTPPTTSSALPTATYALEGEMTYNGNRFYPDGELMADFANAEVSGGILLDGAEAADYFGGTTLADGTPITNSDNLILGFGDILNAADSGVISDDAFSGNLYIVAAGGFFSSLSGTGTYSGRFNDDISNYDAATAAPQEVSGIFGGITDANGNTLNGGFLGQCSADCEPPLPIIGISSSADTIQEGGQVALMITSDTVASAGGFLVTIDISGAMDGEFTTTPASVCDSNLVCRVTILENERSVNLILSPTDDSDNTENTENWMATLRDGSNYNRDAGNNNVAFDIVDPLTLPTAMNGRTLAELNAYDIPTVLATNVIRNLQSDDIGGVTITASRYGDAAAPDVFVQMLEFAALGIWVNGNTPAINGVDHDFDYAFLGDNVVSTLPNSGAARYDIEGDATYRGVNFFPDGNLNMDFEMNSFSGSMGVSGAFGPDHFGSATAMVPDLDDLDADGDTAELRPIASTDIWQINLIGDIDSDGFTSMPNISGALGFFADLSSGAPATGNTMAGRFYDAAGYNPASGDPSEIAGAGIIVDSDGTGDVHFGFVGRCTLACTP